MINFIPPVSFNSEGTQALTPQSFPWKAGLFVSTATQIQTRKRQKQASVREKRVCLYKLCTVKLPTLLHKSC